jgi:hypothetical protein
MITKKDGEKFIVYSKTKLHTEVKVDGTEIDMPTKVYDGTKEALEMEIKQLTDNIAREQAELKGKQDILTEIKANEK